MFITAFAFSYQHYRELKPFEQGISTYDGFSLNDIEYLTSYKAENEFDLSNYFIKMRNEDISYHIVESKNPIVAVFMDYRVYPIEDDPNGYVYQTEDDLFTGSLYYAKDIEFPNPAKNSIRRLIITQPMIDSSSYEGLRKITDLESIDTVLTYIESNKDPKELLETDGISVDDGYSIWIDYFDFPMYQLIYKNSYTTEHATWNTDISINMEKQE